MFTAGKYRSALENVDWGFPQTTTFSGSVHALHWFPGNFIPQIPAYLIQLLSAPGETVLDPFCGSGTTGVEAVLQGRRSVQSDANRACVSIARGKMAAATGGSAICKSAGAVLRELVWDPMLRSDAPGRKGEGQDPELCRWYHRDTLAQLRWLWRLVESNDNTPTSALLGLIFTDVLFACAAPLNGRTASGLKRRHHWGWVADNVTPKGGLPRHNAIAIFRERFTKAIKVLEGLGPAPGVDGGIAHADVRGLACDTESVDLVVTSPPYLGMIDYTLANRLTYLWMNWPVEEDLGSEIGARRRRNRGHALADYLTAMESAVGEIARVLRPGGRCALVVGASRKYESAGLDVISRFQLRMDLIWGPIERTPMRRRVSERQGRAPTERICVFQRR